MNGLPYSWRTCEGKDLFEIVRGVSYDKSMVRATPHEGFIPVLRATNIQSGRIVANELVFVPEKFISEKQHLRPGDLLIATSSGSKDIVGKGAKADHSHSSFAFGAFCSVARPRNNILGDWLGYFAQSAEYRTFVERVALGININNFRTSDLARLPIPTPPVPEQRRIVTKLDSLTGGTARAREELGRIPRLIQKYREAILTAAFSGNLTREWRQKEGNKTAWSTRPAGQIITAIVAGKNLRCEERPPHDDENGVVKVSAVTWGTFDPSAAKTLPSNFSPPDRTRIRSGDFLISRANTLELVGAVVIVDRTPGNLFLSDKILRLEMQDIYKRWLLWFLRSPEGRKAIEGSATGNQLSMRNLSQDALSKIDVPWPDDEERQEIARRIETAFAWLDRVAAEHANASRLLPKLDQAILAKAFRGELVLPERGEPSHYSGGSTNG